MNNLPDFNVKESNPKKWLEANQKSLTHILQPLKNATHKLVNIINSCQLNCIYFTHKV
jgi:hypothetical protein